MIYVPALVLVASMAFNTADAVPIRSNEDTLALRQLTETYDDLLAAREVDVESRSLFSSVAKAGSKILKKGAGSAAKKGAKKGAKSGLKKTAKKSTKGALKKSAKNAAKKASKQGKKAGKKALAKSKKGAKKAGKSAKKAAKEHGPEIASNAAEAAATTAVDNVMNQNAPQGEQQERRSERLVLRDLELREPSKDKDASGGGKSAPPSGVGLLAAKLAGKVLDQRDTATEFDERTVGSELNELD